MIELEGQVALWHLDEADGDWLDASGNVLDVLDTGAGSAAGALNGCRTLAGCNGRPSVTSPLLNPHAGITLAGWARINDSQWIGSNLLQVLGGGNFAFQVLFDDDGSGRPTVELLDGNSNPTSGPVGLGCWFFVAAQWAEGWLSKLRVNGNTYAGTPGNTGTDGDGTLNWGGGAGADFDVDEWRAFNRLLSDEELDLLLACGLRS